MFTDYSALRAAVIAWAGNQAVTDQVDTFIMLCHTELNRVLRISDMEELALIDTVASEPWLPWPIDYMGMRRMRVNDSQGCEVTSIPLSDMDQRYPHTVLGRPTYYSVVGRRFRLGPVPEGAFSIEIAYYKRVPTLSATQTTNVFLTVASDLLLYGSLLKAEMYLKDHEMLETWRAGYNAGIVSLTEAAEGEAFPHGDMAMRAL